MHLRIADLVLFRWGHWLQRAVYSAKHASRFSIDETLKKEEKKATQAAVLYVIKDSPSMRNNISSIINKYALRLTYNHDFFFKSVLTTLLISSLACKLWMCFVFFVFLMPAEDEKLASYWNNKGKQALFTALQNQPNVHQAKNLILFLGDGESGNWALLHFKIFQFRIRFYFIYLSISSKILAALQRSIRARNFLARRWLITLSAVCCDVYQVKT